MTTDLDRDRQIELMRTAQQRMQAKAAEWARVPVIRDALKRPAAGQREDGYVQTVTNVARRA